MFQKVLNFQQLKAEFLGESKGKSRQIFSGLFILNYIYIGDCPGSPVVNTLPSDVGCAGLIPGRGAKIPNASRPKNQNIKQKQYCNKFNKDLKKGPHQKKFFLLYLYLYPYACEIYLYLDILISVSHVYIGIHHMYI